MLLLVLHAVTATLNLHISQVFRRVDVFNQANVPVLFVDVLTLRNEEGCLQASSRR